MVLYSEMASRISITNCITIVFTHKLFTRCAAVPWKRVTCTSYADHIFRAFILAYKRILYSLSNNLFISTRLYLYNSRSTVFNDY